MSRDPKSRGRPAASRRVVLMLGAILTIATLPAQAQESEGVLWDLSIEELMELDLVTVSVLGSHTHLKGEWMVGYKYMIMGMDGNLDGTPQLTTQDVLDSYMVSPLAMTMEMHMVDVMYAPSDALTLMVPYMRLAMDRTNRMATDFTTDANGVGDLLCTRALLRIR